MQQPEDVNRGVLASVTEFLGGPHPDGEGWVFAFDEHLESNWGAVYGGALAAGALAVARCAAPDRLPRSLHIQMIRSVPRGPAYATAEVRHAGRTVGTVVVDLHDARRKLAATVLVTMVVPGAVAAQHHDTTAIPFRVATTPFETKTLFLAPVQQSLKMLREVDGVYHRAFADNVRPSVDGTPSPVGTITVPWDGLKYTGPEVSCLAADPMIAAAVLPTLIPREVVGPNPDLSLRFTTAPATRVIQTSGTMLSVQHGTATIAIEVQAGDQLLAHGLGTSLFIPPK